MCVRTCVGVGVHYSCISMYHCVCVCVCVCAHANIHVCAYASVCFKQRLCDQLENGVDVIVDACCLIS